MHSRELNQARKLLHSIWHHSLSICTLHYTTKKKKLFTQKNFSRLVKIFSHHFSSSLTSLLSIFFLEIHAPIPIKNFIYFTDFLARVISRSPVFSCDEKQKTENSPRWISFPVNNRGFHSNENGKNLKKIGIAALAILMVPSRTNRCRWWKLLRNSLRNRKRNELVHITIAIL